MDIPGCVGRAAGPFYQNGEHVSTSTTKESLQATIHERMNECVLTSSLLQHEAQFAVVDGALTKLPFSAYFGRNIWLILVFIPTQTPHINRTDIIALNERQLECNALGCQIVVVSSEQHYSILAMLNGSYPSHLGGINKPIKIPIIADNNRQLKSIFPVQRGDTRSLYLVDPKGAVRHYSISCDSVGVGVDESIRLLKAFQFTDVHGEVCPINWTPGNKTIVPNVNDSKEFFSSNSINEDHENITRISFSLPTSPSSRTLFEKISAYIDSMKQAGSSNIARCITAYDRQLVTNPLRTKVITAAALAIAGEIITSSFNLKNPVSRWLSNALALPTGAEDDRANTVTIQKVICAGIHGGISGAVYHYWFQLLAKLMEYNKYPHLAKYIPLIQLAIDQLVMTPAFTLFTMAFMHFNKDNMSSIWSHIKRQYSISLIVTWKKYLVMQGVNFLFIPQHRQVLFGDLTKLFWKIFLYNIECYN